jgi:hypothetical protein
MPGGDLTPGTHVIDPLIVVASVAVDLGESVLKFGVIQLLQWQL